VQSSPPSRPVPESPKTVKVRPDTTYGTSPLQSRNASVLVPPSPKPSTSTPEIPLTYPRTNCAYGCAKYRFQYQPVCFSFFQEVTE
jgi:hypothetical protein